MSAGMHAGIVIAAALAALAGCCAAALGAEFHVAPDGKDSNAGTKDSPWPLAKANATAKPGDTVVLLDGTYADTPIAPAQSGQEGKAITYRAATPKQAVFGNVREMPGPYPDDDSDNPAVIFLQNRSHVAVRGIKVLKTNGRWVFAFGASHIAVEDCHFEGPGGGWESCRFKRVGDGIVFRNNFVKGGGDSVAITGGSGHRVEGNTFDTAQHTCLVLMGVQRSVVRRNKLTNPVQKLMEVFTGRRRDFGEEIRKSRHLLIEDNLFGPAAFVADYAAKKKSGSAAIQYAGNEAILRRNVMFKCGMGMDFSQYGEGKGRDDPEALYNEHNRFYNNTIYDCGWPAGYGSGPGIWIAGRKSDFGDQAIVNNILFLNNAHPDAHYPKDTPLGIQVAMADPAHSRFLHNCLRGEVPGSKVFYNKRAKEGFTLREYEAKFPQGASGNIEADPGFVKAPEHGSHRRPPPGGEAAGNVSAEDFRLKPGSPCMDAGAPLTKAKGAGKGTDIEVEDALFFCDGYGIVEPDTIRIGQARAKISKVDCEKNRIALAEPVSWEAGAPVSLDYKGKAPDMGAFESNGDDGRK